MEAYQANKTFRNEYNGAKPAANTKSDAKTGSKLKRNKDNKSEIDGFCGLRYARDWSYACRQLFGENYLLVGDAAMFVDPTAAVENDCAFGYQHLSSCICYINYGRP